MNKLQAFAFAGWLFANMAPCLQPLQADEAVVIVDGHDTVCGEAPAGDTLTWKFANHVQVEPGKNLLISPQNCWHALSLVYLGAEGDTRSELEKVVNPMDLHKEAILEFLGLGESYLQPSCISSAAFFVSPKVPVRPAYQELLQSAGLEKIETLNFLESQESMNTINNWVKSATKGKITKLVTDSDINEDTVAMLVAALHFKASWQKPFNREATRNRPFHTLAGDTVEVPMMQQVASFRYAALEGFEYVALPYASQGPALWEMEVVLLPQVRPADAVCDLSILAEDLRNASVKRRVDLSMPKFSASMRWDVRKTLEEMGISTPFSDFADFSLISESPLKIQKIFQECCIDVNEEGTEGAAATAVGFSLLSFREKDAPIPVVIDRPFYFILREQYSGTVLFFGLIDNPISGVQ